ncbi:hypothetical protein [Thermococcus sp.]|uniref:hypothetical protein n=1 Tax=Thermococcus sp. TaxID=35749 RepID=UPI0025E384B8|nr:hypothetical protein [Thermococcus sp.]
MRKAEKIVLFVLIVLLLFYFLHRGLLIPTNAGGIQFDSTTPSSIPCPPSLRVEAEYYQLKLDHFMNFTLILNGTLRVNMTLKGPAGKHFCTPEGVFIYAYYPGDEYLGVDAAFFDYNLTLKWKRHLPGVPYKNTPDGLILVNNPTFGSSGGSCAYIWNVSPGRIISWICPDITGGHISHVKIFRGRVYVTVGVPEAPPLRTKAFIYVKENNKLRKSEIASIRGEGVGIRLLIDANEEYMAVAYFLANERGEEKNGVCVLTAKSLRKIACKELKEGERLLKIKLEENIVYVQTTKGVKAYRILSLW